MMAAVGGTFRRAAYVCASVALVGACSSSKTAIPFSPPTTGAPPFSTSAGVKPAGAFTEIAHDTNDGLSWKLSKAPGTNGGTCWKVETGPSVDLIQTDVECRAALAAGVPDDIATEWPFETGAKTDHDIFVAFARKPIKDAQFQYVDGKTAKPTYLDKKNGVVAWAGKSKPTMAAAQITMADDSKIDCGPGDVQSSSQLADKSEKEISEARQFVWTCIADA